MIIIAAWLSKQSGLGHYTRAKKYFDFLRKRKKKVKFITFINLSDLFSKIKRRMSNILLLDSYLFSKKIEKLIRKNFNKIIIINDYQFKIPKDFYLLDTFKFSKIINHKKKYLGQKYAVKNINRSYISNKKEYDLLVILNSKNQNFFYKIHKSIKRIKYKKIKNVLFINVLDNKIKNKFQFKDNYKIKSFISQKMLIKYAQKSNYIISPGGQTMINLVENKQFINVYQTSNNQKFYIKELHKNKFVKRINLKKLNIKKNIINKNYIYSKKNKILEMFK